MFISLKTPETQSLTQYSGKAERTTQYFWMSLHAFRLYNILQIHVILYEGFAKHIVL